MNFKLRNYCTNNDNYKFIISTLVGLTSYAFLLLLVFYIFSKALNILHFEFDINFIYKWSFGHPISIMLFLFLVMKYLKWNDPKILSLLVGLTSVFPILIIELISNDKIILWIYFKNFVSVSTMIFIWIILLQTNKNISKSLSAGYFILLVSEKILDIIRELIIYHKINFVSIIIGFALYILFTIIFEHIVKFNFKILKFKPESANS